MRFIKTAAKWAGILLLLGVGGAYLGELDFQTRTGWFIGGLALGLAYVDGSLKDRISMLEARVDQLNRQLNGF